MDVMKFVKVPIYEVKYTIENKKTGWKYDCNVFIQAESIEKAKEDMKETINNELYKLVKYTIRETVTWKRKKESIPWDDLMPVVCIKSRGINYPRAGVKGEKYFIQRSSIYMDPDGTAYGTLFEDNEGTVLMCNVRLDRFMSI